MVKLYNKINCPEIILLYIRYEFAGYVATKTDGKRIWQSHVANIYGKLYFGTRI